MNPTPTAATSSSAPLAGMRIVELSSFVASPLAGMVLAQLGAEVIRIDPIGGAADRQRWPLAPGGESLYWAGLNKGKRSITVDLRSAAGRDLVGQIIARSGPGGGIVITNAREVAGLDVASLRERRRDLIHLRLTGRRGGGSSVDYTANARSGFAMITGAPESTLPTNNVVPVWDLAAGLYLAVGLLAAERRRSRTGQGESIELALDDVATATAGNLGYLPEAELCAQPRARLGNQIYGDLGREFRCSDGVYVMILVITTRQWRDLVNALDLATLVDTLEAQLRTSLSHASQRFKHREILNGLIAGWVSSRTFEEVRDVLTTTTLLWSRFDSFNDAVTRLVQEDHPILTSIAHPGVDTHHATGSPLVFASSAMPARSAPTLGGDTDSVLSELLDLNATQIEKLHDEGIVQ